MAETYRTERIIIQPGHENHDACRRYCSATRKVYNQANYLMRQSFIQKAFLSHSDTDKVMKAEFAATYALLPSAMAQRTIQVLGDNWKSFFEASKDFAVNPAKYKARPRLPHYSQSAKTTVINRNGYKIEKGYLSLAGGKAFGFQKQKITCCQNQPYNAKKDATIVSDVRIVPLGTSFVIELCAKVSATKPRSLNPEHFLSIDIGIENLVTFVTNQPALRPVLIKGTVIKSINAKYNKDKADLVSRHMASKKSRDNFKAKHVKSKSCKRHRLINDYFHKTSCFVIDYCIQHDIGNIVVGLNKDWKQEISIGKVNNQKFVSIPHKKLIDQLIYKGESAGIKVTVREESYTSKASALDMDAIPTHQKDQKNETKFSGRRLKRGLYKTKQGFVINADVNGAANILRKEIGDEWLKPAIEPIGALWTTPVVYKLNRSKSVKATSLEHRLDRVMQRAIPRWHTGTAVKTLGNPF